MGQKKLGAAVHFCPDFVLGQDLKKRFGPENCPVLNTPEKIAAAFSNIATLEREVMLAGALDCKCRLLYCSLLAVGTSDRLLVRVGEAFHGVIRSVGSSIFLVHNHPSGSLNPSEQDLQLTQDVAEAGMILGYPLVDHVIVSANGYRSLMSPTNAPAQTLSQAAEDNGDSVSKCNHCNSLNRLDIYTVNVQRMIPVTCRECRTFSWLKATD